MNTEATIIIAATIGLGGVLLLLAFRMRVGAERALTDAERKLQEAVLAKMDAERKLGLAVQVKDEVRRLEENLLNPAVAFDPETGRFRGLKLNEALRPGELLAEPPLDTCKNCWGRGWREIDRATKRRIPCKCIRVKAGATA